MKRRKSKSGVNPGEKRYISAYHAVKYTLLYGIYLCKKNTSWYKVYTKSIFLWREGLWGVGKIRVKVTVAFYLNGA
jgi:hypothetical protein